MSTYIKIFSKINVSKRNSISYYVEYDNSLMKQRLLKTLIYLSLLS